eukprot:tig00020675_g12694.t1
MARQRRDPDRPPRALAPSFSSESALEAQARFSGEATHRPALAYAASELAQADPRDEACRTATRFAVALLSESVGTPTSGPEHDLEIPGEAHVQLEFKISIAAGELIPLPLGPNRVAVIGGFVPRLARCAALVQNHSQRCLCLAPEVARIADNGLVAMGGSGGVRYHDGYALFKMPQLAAGAGAGAEPGHGPSSTPRWSLSNSNASAGVSTRRRSLVIDALKAVRASFRHGSRVLPLSVGDDQKDSKFGAGASSRSRSASASEAENELERRSIIQALPRDLRAMEESGEWPTCGLRKVVCACLHITCFSENGLESTDDAFRESSRRRLHDAVDLATALIDEGRGVVRGALASEEGLVILATWGACGEPATCQDAWSAFQAAVRFQKRSISQGMGRASIGISFSRAVCGFVAEGSRAEFACVGEACERAASLMRSAAGGICIDDELETRCAIPESDSDISIAPMSAESNDSEAARFAVRVRAVEEVAMAAAAIANQPLAMGCLDLRRTLALSRDSSRVRSTPRVSVRLSGGSGTGSLSALSAAAEAAAAAAARAGIRSATPNLANAGAGAADSSAVCNYDQDLQETLLKQLESAESNVYGRRTEMERVVDLIVSARTGGAGRTLFVEGKAGIGKSCMVSEAERLASLAGVPVLLMRPAPQEMYAFRAVRELVGCLFSLNREERGGGSGKPRPKTDAVLGLRDVGVVDSAGGAAPEVGVLEQISTIGSRLRGDGDVDVDEDREQREAAADVDVGELEWARVHRSNRQFRQQLRPRAPGSIRSSASASPVPAANFDYFESRPDSRSVTPPPVPAAPPPHPQSADIQPPAATFAGSVLIYKLGLNESASTSVSSFKAGETSNAAVDADKQVEENECFRSELSAFLEAASAPLATQENVLILEEFLSEDKQVKQRGGSKSIATSPTSAGSNSRGRPLEAFVDVPMEEDSPASRQFRFLASLLQALMRKLQCILLIDDLYALDAMSTKLISFIGLCHTTYMLVTSRPVPPHTVCAEYSSLRSSVHTLFIKLNPIASVEEARGFLAHALKVKSEHLSEALAVQLLDKSGGSPAVLKQMASHLVRTGLVKVDGGRVLASLSILESQVAISAASRRAGGAGAGAGAPAASSDLADEDPEAQRAAQAIAMILKSDAATSLGVLGLDRVPPLPALAMYAIDGAVDPSMVAASLVVLERYGHLRQVQHRSGLFGFVFCEELQADVLRSTLSKDDIAFLSWRSAKYLVRTAGSRSPSAAEAVARLYVAAGAKELAVPFFEIAEPTATKQSGYAFLFRALASLAMPAIHTRRGVHGLDNQTGGETSNYKNTYTWANEASLQAALDRQRAPPADQRLRVLSDALAAYVPVLLHSGDVAAAAYFAMKRVRLEAGMPQGDTSCKPSRFEDAAATASGVVALLPGRQRLAERLRDAASDNCSASRRASAGFLLHQLSNALLHGTFASFDKMATSVISVLRSTQSSSAVGEALFIKGIAHLLRGQASDAEKTFDSLVRHARRARNSNHFHLFWGLLGGASSRLQSSSSVSVGLGITRALEEAREKFPDESVTTSRLAGAACAAAVRVAEGRPAEAEAEALAGVQVLREQRSRRPAALAGLPPLPFCLVPLCQLADALLDLLDMGFGYRLAASTARARAQAASAGPPALAYGGPLLADFAERNSGARRRVSPGEAETERSWSRSLAGALGEVLSALRAGGERYPTVAAFSAFYEGRARARARAVDGVDAAGRIQKSLARAEALARSAGLQPLEARSAFALRALGPALGPRPAGPPKLKEETRSASAPHVAAAV